MQIRAMKYAALTAYFIAQRAGEVSFPIRFEEKSFGIERREEQKNGIFNRSKTAES